MNFNEWLQFGIDSGWCSPIHCETHDGVIITPEEHQQIEQNEELCLYIVRIAHDPEHFKQLQDTNIWRARAL